MKNIILVGSGNVATHLGIALQNCNYKIVQVYSRSIENAKNYVTSAIQNEPGLGNGHGPLNHFFMIN